MSLLYYCDNSHCEVSHEIRFNPLYSSEQLAVTKAVGTVSRVFIRMQPQLSTCLAGGTPLACV